MGNLMAPVAADCHGIRLCRVTDQSELINQSPSGRFKADYADGLCRRPVRQSLGMKAA